MHVTAGRQRLLEREGKAAGQVQGINARLVERIMMFSAENSEWSQRFGLLWSLLACKRGHMLTQPVQPNLLKYSLSSQNLPSINSLATVS